MNRSALRRGSWDLLAVSMAFLFLTVAFRSRHQTAVPARLHPPAVEPPSETSVTLEKRAETQSFNLKGKDYRLKEKESRGAKEVGDKLTLSREDILRRRGDAFAYNSGSYGATVEKGGLRFALPAQARSERSHLEYALEEVRRGSLTVAVGGEQPPIASPDELKLSYNRGTVEEQYVFSPQSVEQIFVVKSLPETSGDLVVVGRVSTNLTAPASGAPSDRLTFVRDENESITVSEAVAIDASGRRLPLSLSCAEGRISVTVPEAWLAKAELPIVIDPAIGGVIPLRSNITTVGFNKPIDVAYNPTDNLWFAVWSEVFGGGSDTEVVGQFIRPTGAPVGTPFTISGTPERDQDLSVSYAPAPVNRFLVVWSHWPLSDPSGVTESIQGRVLSGTGSFVTPTFTVDDRTETDVAPRAAFDGTNWYVAWVNYLSSSQTSTQIVGRFVSKDGVPGLKVDADQNVQIKSGGLTGVAFSNGNYVIAWCGGAAANSNHTTYARTMTPAGVLGAVKSVTGGDSFDIGASNGKFMIVGGLNYAPYTYWVATLDSALNVTGPVTTQFEGQVACRIGSTPGWHAITMNATNVIGYPVTEAGAVSAAVTYFPNASGSYPAAAAWSSTLDEVLVVTLTGLSGPTYGFQAQRFSPTTTLGTPGGLTGTAGAGGVTLKWAPSTGATGFNVKRRTSPTGSYTTVAANVLDTTYLDTSVSAGTTYLYVVTATNGATESAPSNEVSVMAQAVLAAPTGVFTGFGNGFISVNWSAVTGATSYNVKRAGTSAGPFTQISPAGYSNLAYTDSGLAPGATYWYVISAVNASGESANSAPPVQGTAYGPVGTPTGLTATPGNSKVTLAWNVPAWVTGGYSVKRGTAPGGPFSTLVANWAQNTYVDSTAINANRYYYVVTAWGTNGESAPSNVATAAPMSTVPATPTGVVATAGNAQVTISWTPVAGADTYSIYQSTPLSSGPYTSIASGLSSPSYTKTGLTNGTQYWYQVTATDYLGASPASTAVTATPHIPPPATPTGLTALGLNDRITLSWNAVSGATGYEIRRGIANGGPYSTTASTSSTTWTDSGVQNGTTYYYVVVAYNAGGTSAPTGQASAVPNPPAAINTLLIVGNTTLTTSDAAIKSRLAALGYTVVVKSDSGSASTDATGKALVVISSTVSSGNVGTKFRSVSVPVLAWENAEYQLSYLSMTGPTANTDYGTLGGQTLITITNPSHPMAGGLSGDVSIVTTGNPAQTVAWGIPNANAVTIARATPDTGANPRQVIFGYDTGASMPVASGAPAFYAPARRVGFFLTDTTASTLTNAGWSLFDAAVRWAAGTPIVPIVRVNVSSGRADITWDPTPGALSYTVRRGTSPTNLVAIATGLTQTEFIDIGLTNGITYYWDVVAQNDSGQSAPPPPVAATPVATIFAVSAVIMGPNVIRQYTNDSAWNTGTYTLEIWYLDANNNLQTIPAGKTTTVSWLLLKANTLARSLPGKNFLFPSPEGLFTARSNTGATITSTGNEGSAMIRADITVKNADNSVFATGSTSAEILFTKRKVLKITIHFPEDAAADASHRTTRNGADGHANQFFDTDSTTRETARRAYASSLNTALETRLKPLGIRPYVNADLNWRVPDTDIPNTEFTGAGEYQPLTGAGDDSVCTDGFRQLKGRGTQGYVHIWLVHRFDPALNILGVTYGSTCTPNPCCAVQDPADNGLGDAVIAHEIGHCLGLPDIKDYPFDVIDQDGWINNRRRIEIPGSHVHRQYFMMWYAASNLDYRWSRDETENSRNHASDNQLFGGQNEDP